MNILLATHQMADFSGSEIYTFELAKALQKLGHSVMVYSRYLDKFEPWLKHAHIRHTMHIADLAREHFDVAHVQHNITAMEVRSVFPDLPLFFLSHGSDTFLEQKPFIDINVAQYAAVSDRVKSALNSQGVPKKSIVLVKNVVDDQLFTPTTPCNAQPKQALIISNRMLPKTVRVIEKACAKLGMTLNKVGQPFGSVPYAKLAAKISQADIVFTIGRGVVETMMCGKIPFVYDSKGGDGIVTEQNYAYLEKHHFNGYFAKRQFTSKQIMQEIESTYDAKSAPRLRTRTLRRYGSSSIAPQMVELYEKAITKHKPMKINLALLNACVEAIQVTRLHTFSRSERRSLRRHAYDVFVRAHHLQTRYAKKVKQVEQLAMRSVHILSRMKPEFEAARKIAAAGN